MTKNNRNTISILRKYTYLLMGVLLFGNVWGQEAVFNSNDSIVLDKWKKEIDEKITSLFGDGTVKGESISGTGQKGERIVPARRTLNTIMVGVGSSNMYDTYLSPLEYTGYSLHVMDERMRDTYWFNGKFRKQQIIELEFASGENPARNSREYWLRARYQLGGHYRLYRNAGMQLSAGGFWDINAGGLYNERNGNNPATGRVYTNLNVSAMASYKWKKYSIRWQMDMPFVGVLFSPRYGQSYYEISLGNTVGIVNFASLHNQRALRNLVTVDVPFNKYMIRVGYLGDFYQTKVHSIQTHHYTHSFVIGFPLEGIKRDKEKTTNSYWD